MAWYASASSSSLSPPTRLGQAPNVAAQLTPPQAQQLIDRTLADMGISGQAAANISTQVYGSLTSGDLDFDNVSTAAVNGGITYAESLLQQETGVPIRLPRKLTLAELERSVMGLIPTDAMEAVDLAITVGAQAVASAVTSLLVGAGVGSVIPGIGTVVGIGVALGVGALREALAEGPQPYERVCETPQQVCPTIPHADPLSLVFTAAQRNKALEEALAAEQARQYCGRGPLVDCNNQWALVLRLAYEASYPTVRVLGSGQVDYYLSTLQHAPTSMRSFNPRSGRIEDVTIQEVAFTLQALRDRRARLDAFIAAGDSIATLPQTQLEQFRWTLYREELPQAALQYQNLQNDQTRAWLVRVAQYKDELMARDAGQTAALQQQVQQAMSIAAQRLSTERGSIENEIQIKQLACDDGNRTACRRVAELTARLNEIDAAARRDLCAEIVTLWEREFPQQAACLQTGDRDILKNYCAEAFRNPAYVNQYLQAWGALVASRCAARGGFLQALVRGFTSSGRVLRG